MPTVFATSAEGAGAEKRPSVDDGRRAGERPAGLRVDRWLWRARLFKTRGLAVEAVKGGHVRVNGQRIKPAREVMPGDALRVVRGDEELELTVTAIPERRGPAPEAREAYVESPESVERRRLSKLRRATASLGPPTRGRPDKRTRRLIRSRHRS
jgi:ribosome-associated heat shock protein Hsp15